VEGLVCWFCKLVSVDVLITFLIICALWLEAKLIRSFNDNLRIYMGSFAFVYLLCRPGLENCNEYDFCLLNDTLKLD